MSINLWGADVTVRVSSAAPDAEPVWQDISAYVIVPSGTTIETWLGRATELSSSEPGKFRLMLLNNDDRFTTGNPTSPYVAWWKQSRRLQIIETLADKDYVLADGYLEIPQTVVATQPVDPAAPKLITVGVTGVDVIARLRNSRKFKSALSEHIIYTGGSDLKGYWPMTEAAQPFNGAGPTTAPLDMQLVRTGTTGLAVSPQPNTGLAPVGGEASGARMVTAGNGTSGHAFTQVAMPSGFAPAIGATDAVVVVFWISLPAIFSSNTSAYHKVAGFVGPLANIALEMTSSSRTWVLTSTGMTGTITGPTVADEALLPIGIYVNESTSTLELWTGSVRQTTTLAGAPGGTGTLFWSGMGYQLDYDLSHLQIYVGNNFTYSTFLEQISQAYAPLDKQRTGQRVNTILNYAGFPAARRDIDPGASVMSTATLFGKTAGTALEEATTTERGRLFAQAGRVQFHDRIRVLNV